jgi:protein-S-isoprenylcysteine O-methyltransferase Ste14
MKRSARAATAFALQALLSGAVALWGRGVRTPAAGAAQLVMLVALCAAFAAFDASAQVGDDPREIPRLDRGLAIATSAGLALAMLGSVLHVASAGGVAGMGRFIAGLSLATCGALLRARAISVLGRSFVTGARPLEPALVARDVYAWLRHPSEVGLWIVGIGLFVATRSWAAGLGLALVAASSVVRIRREERFLRALTTSAGA